MLWTAVEEALAPELLEPPGCCDDVFQLSREVSGHDEALHEISLADRGCVRRGAAAGRDRRAPAADILFIGANADPTFGDDGFVFDYLTDDLGHDVTYIQASASTTADGEEVDLIILSSTPGSGDIRSKFLNLSTPILNWEEAIMDGNTAAGNFAMGQGAENGTAAPGTQIQILDPNHPLAGGTERHGRFRLGIRFPIRT